MSINVEFKKNLQNTSNSKLDLIPVFFDYSGPAKIDEYFHHKISQDEKTKLKKNYLFGRNLSGKNFDLKKNSIKICEIEENDNDDNRVYNVIDEFSQFDEWVLEDRISKEPFLYESLDFFGECLDVMNI